MEQSRIRIQGRGEHREFGSHVPFEQMQDYKYGDYGDGSNPEAPYHRLGQQEEESAKYEQGQGDIEHHEVHHHRHSRRLADYLEPGFAVHIDFPAFAVGYGLYGIRENLLVVGIRHFKAGDDADVQAVDSLHQIPLRAQVAE